jgi:hypothetical protein
MHTPSRAAIGRNRYLRRDGRVKANSPIGVAAEQAITIAVQ